MLAELAVFRTRTTRYLRRLADCIEAGRRPARPPDATELEALTEHVAYELAAMEASAEAYTQSRLWLPLDAFLLHARQLRDFFWVRWSPTSKFAESSVLAEHYSASCRGVRGGYPVAIERTKGAIDKQLAHITRERNKPGLAIDLANEVTPLRTELIATWKRFLQHLGADKSAQSFRNAVAKKCAELQVSVP